MKAKTKSKPSRPQPTLPAGCEALLSREQVRLALGGISDRMLTKLISLERFPGPNARIGSLPRWSTQLVNQWIQAQTNGRRVPQAE